MAGIGAESGSKIRERNLLQVLEDQRRTTCCDGRNSTLRHISRSFDPRTAKQHPTAAPAICSSFELAAGFHPP
jgi:hypothetical protein